MWLLPSPFQTLRANLPNKLKEQEHSVQFSRYLCLTHWNPVDCSTPGFPVHHQLPQLAHTHIHWVDEANKRSHALSSPFPPAFNLSQHQGRFQCESVLRIRWPKYWSFSFSISPSSEYSGLISFRMDWLDLLAVQGTLNSLLQHCSWETSFFGAQLSLWSNSHPYMTTEKPYSIDYMKFCQQSNVSAF